MCFLIFFNVVSALLSFQNGYDMKYDSLLNCCEQFASVFVLIFRGINVKGFSKVFQLFVLAGKILS